METMTQSTWTCPELFDYQKDHCDKLTASVLANGYAKDGSDTGTGKTVVALTVAHRLGLTPLVICPKAVVPSWEEWCEKFNLTGYKVFNYEKIRRGKTGFYRKKSQYAGEFTKLASGADIIIFDEDHRCKSYKSENSKLMIAAKAGGIPTLALGATSCTNPVEMRALGFLLDMHNNSDWWNWCLRNGCKKGTFGGLKFRGFSTVLKRFHDHIYTAGRGSRIRIKDLPPGSFPETLIVADGYDLDSKEASRIDGIYEELENMLEDLDVRKSEDEYSALTEQLRARQKVELLKVPIFDSLTRDAHASGNSIVIFVNFRNTAQALLNNLTSLDNNIGWIGGSQNKWERELEVKRFQRNESRILICMTQAGGTGLSLHDENGDYPRVSLISPSFSAIDLKQALGRVHRATGKTPSIQKIVFANDTIEMGVCDSVRKKLNNIDLINDDEMNPIL